MILTAMPISAMTETKSRKVYRLEQRYYYVNNLLSVSFDLVIAFALRKQISKSDSTRKSSADRIICTIAIVATINPSQFKLSILRAVITPLTISNIRTKEQFQRKRGTDDTAEELSN
jgi:hypothetical protein